MIQEYLDEMKEIHQAILDFIDEIEIFDSKFQILDKVIMKNKIVDDKSKFKSFLQMINLIVDNHCSDNLFSKITKTLLFYKDKITISFQNFEIYTIFESNKKIILFLIKSNFITIDSSIVHRISNKFGTYFFYPEIKSLIKDQIIIDDNINFDEKRLNGENDSYICSLIRNDSVEKFIIMVNQKNIPLSSQIDFSIFETNSFLLKKRFVNLIEYAALYGAIQIFRYLYLNGVELKTSLWSYVIRGRNCELLDFLKEKKVEFNIKKILTESIKCHHNEITVYIINNLLSSPLSEYQNYIQMKSLKYFNFQFIQNTFDVIRFSDLCKYNQTCLFKILTKIKSFDVNERKLGRSNSDITLLSQAILKDNIELVKLLLSYDQIDVNMLSYFPIVKNSIGHKEPYSPIYLAIDNENIEIIKLLLSNDKIIINYHYKSVFEYYHNCHILKSPFALAIEKKNNEILKLLLLCRNIDVNYKALYYIEEKKEYNYLTLLHMAIDDENIDIVSFLLSFDNIDVNLKSKCSRYSHYKTQITPLNLAIQKSNIEIVKLLLACDKIDINCESVYSSYIAESVNFKCPLMGKIRPIFLAVEFENIEIIKLLLSNNKIDLCFITTYYRLGQNTRNLAQSLLNFVIQKNNNEIMKILFPDYLNIKPEETVMLDLSDSDSDSW